MLKLFFIFIVFFTFTNAYEAILFEMKYYSSNNLNENQFSFFNNLYKSYLYTYLKIGEPKFDIKTIFFSIFTPHFSLNPTFDNINEEFLTNHYNINKSFTFQNITCLNRYYVLSKKDIAAKEKFVVSSCNLENKKTSEIILNDFDFVFGVNNTNNNEKNETEEFYYLTIGLKQLESFRDEFNFIYLLKEKNITNNYNLLIMFENQKKKR